MDIGKWCQPVGAATRTALLFVVVFVSSCTPARHAGQEQGVIREFYQSAKLRQQHFPSQVKLNLTGLRVQERMLPGCPRPPGADESALVITSTDPRESTAVQIIVTPRVPGSNLDPAVTSDEFVRQREDDLLRALQTNRFVGVHLLDRPAER